MTALCNIQALRGVAALGVVLAHAGTVFAIPYLGWGVAGVDLFFVISGFIIAYTTMRPPSPVVFAAKRVARVVPLYWLLTLAVTAVAFTSPSLLSNTEASVPALLKSLLFIPYEKAPGVVQPMLFVGWTLNYEMFFYGLFALCLLAKGRAAGVCVIIIVVLAALGQLADPTSIAARFYTSPIILEFAFGIMAAIAHQAGFRMRAPLAVAVGLAGVFLLLAGSIAGTEEVRWWTIGLPAALIVSSALSIETAGKLATGRWVQMIGASSYALYLTHAFVLAAVSVAATRLGAPIVLAAAGAVGLAVCCGVLAYLAVERPISRAAAKIRFRRLSGQDDGGRVGVVVRFGPQRRARMNR